MWRAIPHLVMAGSVVVLLSACEPTFKGGAPVTRGPSVGAAGCGPTITAMAGDTVYSLSRYCNVAVRDLIEANGLTPPYALSAGQLLRLPGQGGEYVVQKGDSMMIIARRLKVDFPTFARLNGKNAPYTIYPGEKLRLPGGGDAQAAPQIVAQSAIQPQPLPEKKPPPDFRSVDTGKASPPKTLPENQHAAFQPQSPLPVGAPPPLVGKGFIWPVKGEILSEFGPGSAKGTQNDGINIAAPRGTAIRAVENGVVAYVGNDLKGFGTLLLIKHADGWMSAYAHSDQILVRKGDQVRRGQQVGIVGASGNVTQPQLHFELRHGTDAVNPLDHLKGAA